MPNGTAILIVVQIVLFITIIGILLFISNERRKSKLEKRFENFSLKTNIDEEDSILDKISFWLNTKVKKVSFLLKKSVFFSNYAKKYEKYITFEEKETKENIDYIVLKFGVAFLFGILSFFSLLMKTKKIQGMPFLLASLIGFFIPDVYLYWQFRKKRKYIEEDLLKAIMIMNTSFKAGRNIMQAIVTVKNELEGPIADEFKKIYLDITYGLSLDVVFNRFYERVKLSDAKYIASSLTLLNKTGGNIVHVFDSIEKSFLSKRKLRDELNSLTAASIFMYRILIFLPLFFVLIILLLNPMYFAPLFKGIGLLFFALICILYVAYIFVIKKVMKVNM